MAPALTATTRAVEAAILVTLAGPLHGQELRGHVIDTSTEAGVSGATVQLLQSADSQAVVAGLSGDDGAFSLLSPQPGEFVVRVERIGYQTSVVGPVRLRARGFVEVTLSLGTAALPVEGVNVAVARVPFLENAGFYDRRQKTAGQFMDRKEIEAMHAERIGSVLNTFRGVRVIRTADSVDVQMRGAVANALMGATTCLPPIFLDGVMLSPQFPPSPKIRYNLDLIVAEDIEAMEVYVGPANVPAQFAANGAPCGALVLWRRR